MPKQRGGEEGVLKYPPPPFILGVEGLASKVLLQRMHVHHTRVE